MKLLTLAVASIVDANTHQGYTSQLIGHSPAHVADHIERGRRIRSKSAAGLISQLSSAVSAFMAKSRARAETQRAVGELSRMSEHMLRDIGLNYNDVESLGSGLISLDDLADRRKTNRTALQVITRAEKTTVNASIRDIESINEDCYELAKCS